MAIFSTGGLLQCGLTVNGSVTGDGITPPGTRSAGPTPLRNIMGHTGPVRRLA